MRFGRVARCLADLAAVLLDAGRASLPTTELYWTFPCSTPARRRSLLDADRVDLLLRAAAAAQDRPRVRQNPGALSPRDAGQRHPLPRGLHPSLGRATAAAAAAAGGRADQIDDCVLIELRDGAVGDDPARLRPHPDQPDPSNRPLIAGLYSRAFAPLYDPIVADGGRRLLPDRRRRRNGARQSALCGRAAAAAADAIPRAPCSPRRTATGRSGPRSSPIRTATPFSPSRRPPGASFPLETGCMMRLTDPARMTLRGDLDERLRRAIPAPASTSTPRRCGASWTTPDEIWHWGADYPGRWIATMALLNRILGEDYDVAAAAEPVDRLPAPGRQFRRVHARPPTTRNGSGWAAGWSACSNTTSRRAIPRALDAAPPARRLLRRPTTRRSSPTCTSATPTRSKVWSLLARLTGDPRYATTARQMADTSMVFRQRLAIDDARSARAALALRRSGPLPVDGRPRSARSARADRRGSATSPRFSRCTTTSAGTRSRSPAGSGSTSTGRRRTKRAPTPTGCVSTSSSGG